MTPLALNLVLLSEAVVIGSGAWFIFTLLHTRFATPPIRRSPLQRHTSLLFVGCSVLALGVFLNIFLSSTLITHIATPLEGAELFATMLINVGCSVILLGLPRLITVSFSRYGKLRRDERALRTSSSRLLENEKGRVIERQPQHSQVPHDGVLDEELLEKEGLEEKSRDVTHTKVNENKLKHREIAFASAGNRPELASATTASATTASATTASATTASAAAASATRETSPAAVTPLRPETVPTQNETGEGLTEVAAESDSARPPAGSSDIQSVAAEPAGEGESGTGTPESQAVTASSKTQVSQPHESPYPDTNEKFRAVFYHSPAWFLVIDAQQHIIEVNIRLADFLACERTELLGQPLKNLIKKEDLQLIKGLTPERIRSKGPEFTIDIRLNHREHEALWVKVIPQIITFDSEKEDLLLLLQDIRESKQLSEKIAFHSQFDELTLLHNREGLETYLAQTLDVTSDKYGQIALLYIDVDQLKVVNDTCGHHAGDQLLQQLVAVIGEASESRDFFARMGGDEFALVKTNCSEELAKQLGESVRSAAEDFTFTWQGQQYRQSVSVGIALSCDEINTIIDLIGAADSACYTAKEHGKNRVAMYNGSIETNSRSHHDMQWVSRLQKAIQSGTFELYFQPIEKLKPGPKPHVHYELLIRYVDDQGQHILPQHFLPAVERFGLSEQIDLWVLTTALDYLDKHPEHTKILDCCSINLTSQSIANPRIRSAILQVVQSYSFPLEKICFEITESSAIQNLAEAKEFVRELKTLGCHLALDDFGTGFSSFGYLKYLEVDYIKIDGSFVRDITSDRFDRAMVSAINNIGKEMGIAIIAEYAENASILKVLHHLEIDYAQGNAIAYPLPMYTLESYYQ